MDEIETDGTSSQDSAIDGDERAASQNIYAKEAKLKINYKSLSRDLLKLSPDEVKKAGDSLNRKLLDLHNTLVKIQAPNMKVRYKTFSIKIFSILNRKKD